MKIETAPLTILVVEDNSINAQVASQLLKKLGHATEVATNGSVALRILSQRRFDLVFMDIQMPEMDGYEVTQAIRAGKAGASNLNIPIIAQTASALKGDHERCIAAGMNGYVVKPVYIGDLSQAIQQVFETKSAPPAATAPAPVTPVIEKPVMDKKEAVARLGGDEDIFKEVVKMYLDQMPIRCEEVSRACLSGDDQTVVTLAHTLKSSSATVGAMALQSLFVRLESAARIGDRETMSLLARQIGPNFERYRETAQKIIG
jgi:CheY-like chemotaxis protein/HPt (histidine-containing phosphotransfer) domain-containing protein